MNLATRCTSCGTIFRVVQDQLRVSEGWVRCGRCDAVFDAASSLFDLEQEAPPDWQPTEPPAMDGEPAGATMPLEPVGTAVDGPFVSEDERRWSASMAAQGLSGSEPGAPIEDPPQPSWQASSPASARPATPAFEPPHGLLVRNTEEADHSGHPHEDDDDVIVITDHPSSNRLAVSTLSAASTVYVGPAGADIGASASEIATLDAETPPDFLQRARRQAFWKSGRARGLLGTLAAVLLLALVLQTGQHFSELAAARWPGLRPTLTAWCGLSGCSVGPPHRIDDLVVESTALAPAPGPAATGLRLAVTLRNRASYAVALPSIDLSLTDMSGKLIARRALSPDDFAPSTRAVAASGDLPLQTVLTAAAGAPRVAGYTVEIFYP